MLSINYYLKTVALCLVFFTYLINPLQANSNFGVLACNDTINISLDTNCMVILSPDELLENPDAAVSYRIVITDPTDSTGNYSNNGTAEVTLLKTGFYTYSVVDQDDKTCWGIIRVENKLPPFFVSIPRDTLVRCEIPLTESGIGATKPTVEDYCGSVAVSFITAYFESGDFPCDTSVIASIWKATNAAGEMITDTQRTVIIRPNISQMIFPEDFALSCGEDEEGDLENFNKTGLLSIQIGNILNGVFMPQDTIPIEESSFFCGYGLAKTDIREDNDCQIKVTRYWELLNWCGLSSVPEIVDTQIIQLTDTLAPVFDRHPNDNLANLKRIDLSDDCRFVLDIDPPTATDNCDTLPNVELFEVAQLVNGVWTIIGSNTLINLPADTLRLAYRTWDHCHTQQKESTTFLYVLTKDLTGPVVLCTNNLVIAIPNDSAAVLTADALDGGSYDNCGILTTEIRLKEIDSSWTSSILLPCELIDSQFMVELKVTDVAGNENFCWTLARLEDKVPPICQNLPTQIITCDTIQSNDFGIATDANNNNAFDDNEWKIMSPTQMLTYNETFGNPECDKNVDCQTFGIEQEYQRLDEGCGKGQIKRRYRATDTQGNVSIWAEQAITINYQPDWKITFAADWEGGCLDTIPAPLIDIQSGNCDNLSFYVIENTVVAADHCLMVERIYQVINNCIYTSSTLPYTVNRVEDDNGIVNDSLMISSDSLANKGYLIYRQILKIRSTDRPNLVINEVDSCLFGLPNDSLLLKTDNDCAEIRTFSANATDCTGNAVTRFEWSFFENDQLIDNGTGASFSKAVLPAVDYTIQFTALDACGNQSTDQKDFTFTDCTKPTLFARTGITIELTDKESEIWATDFDKGSFDNCTDQATLLRNFRIWHIQLGAAPFSIDSIRALPTNLSFNCSYLATQEVFIYAFDEAGNFDVVEAFLTVQDNRESCLGIRRVNLGGQILDELGNQIEGVNISLFGDIQVNQTTKDDGNYLFDLPTNRNFTIRPSKLDNPLNGVTTFDLILITKHILGTDLLESPYQHIAADVNRSGSISAFDLVLLRQLILSMIPDFPHNESWRFIDTNYRFTSNNPAGEPFTEVVYIDEMQKDRMEVNFVGVKIGDINGSAIPNSRTNAIGRAATNNYHFRIKDQLVETGEEITIPFIINDLIEVEGLQFGLDFDHLELIHISDGIADKKNFNSNLLNKGQLLISWNKALGQAKNPALMTLTFKAKTTDWLSNLLAINSSKLTPEVYTSFGEMQTINLQFEKTATSNDFQLFQNKPNPFKHQSSISFYLPQSENIHLQIMDIQGRVLQKINGTYQAGLHEKKVDKGSLGASGILYYQLKVGAFTATKKMILLK